MLTPLRAACRFTREGAVVDLMTTTDGGAFKHRRIVVGEGERAELLGMLLHLFDQQGAARG